MKSDHEIALGLTAEQSELLSRAAAAAGQSPAEFAQAAALAAAQEVVLDQVLFTGTAAQMEEFERILKRPCAEIPEVVRLLNKVPLWGNAASG